MKDVVLGIDTSAYTTSICVITSHSHDIVYEKRKLLDVPEGERGLRQNTAVFQHLKNLPYFIEEMCSKINPERLAAVAVSAKPRPADQSYMPVFLAGSSFARTVAASRRIPLYELSHQEGHIAAGVGTLDYPMAARKFLMIHLSGGTSEICLVERPADGAYQIQLLGGTLDLHAGQFVDRVGVKLGLPFPAGKHLELLAQQSQEVLTISSYAKGYDCSFSGPAAKAERLIEMGQHHHFDIARAVEHCIAKTLEKIIRFAQSDTQVADVLIVGGVASNSYLREYLQRRLSHRTAGVSLHFAKREYSTDNAYGIACLGAEKHF